MQKKVIKEIAASTDLKLVVSIQFIDGLAGILDVYSSRI